MEDKEKNQKQLIKEVKFLKKRIEELEKLESERRHTKEEYKAILRTTMDGFWIADMQGRFLEMNDAYCRLIGYSRDELLTMRIPDVEAVETPEETAQRIRRIMETGGDRFETRHRCKDGRIVDIEVSVNYIKEADGRMVVFLRDITERKRIEEELKKHREHLEELVKEKTAKLEQEITERKRTEETLRVSENKYRTLIENLPQKIFLKDKNSVYVSCNENYARDLKIRLDEISGKTDYDFYPKELAEKYRGDDKRIMDKDETENIEERYIQDGKEVMVNTVKTPLKDEKGNTVGILGIFWDITERKRLEEERKKFEEQLVELFDDAKQASKTRSDFIANVCQELRIPLNSILGFAQTLEAEHYGKMNEKQKEYIKDIFEGGKQLLSLINNILDISKIEAGSMELNITRVNFKEILNHVKNLWNEKAMAHSIKFELEISPGFPDEIDGDGQKIKQVLSNFLSNAFKFTPDGGEVIIDARKISEEEIEISVIDNGSGINKEDQEKLFTPFVRLDNTKPGAGLGLLLCKRLVNLWNGKIGVVSPPEGKVKGCRFYFTIYKRR